MKANLSFPKKGEKEPKGPAAKAVKGKKPVKGKKNGPVAKGKGGKVAPKKAVGDAKLTKAKRQFGFE